MNIEEIMSSPVVVTKESTKLKYTRELISRKSINAVPVLKEDGEIAGILSSSDLAKAHDENMTVGDIMTEKVHLILTNNRVQDAAKTMIKHSVHHLVVMEDKDGIGMVRPLDIMRSVFLGFMA